MTRFSILIFCCVNTFYKVLAQEVELQDTNTVTIPTQFFRETHTNFLEWQEPPISFRFSLYDRWGEVIVFTDQQPFFEIDSLIETQHTKLQLDAFYFVEVIFMNSDKIERSIRSKSHYVGYYCSG